MSATAAMRRARDGSPSAWSASALTRSPGAFRSTDRPKALAQSKRQRRRLCSRDRPPPSAIRCGETCRAPWRGP